MPTVTDVHSLCSIKIEMRHLNQPISWGTGFLGFYNNQKYLITARHNLTGVNALTGTSLLTRGYLPPNEIRFSFPYEWQIEEGNTGYTGQPCSMQIIDDNQEALWKVFDSGELKWDVAVIDLSQVLDKKLIKSLSNEDQNFAGQKDFLSDTSSLLESEDWVELSSGKKVRLVSIGMSSNHGFPLRVGDDISIIGYPRGIHTGINEDLPLPIWKRATVASEPMVPVDDLPLMLVDTATREGMSGGFVIARQHRGTLPPDQNGTIISLVNGEITRFVGIYTSRDKGVDEFEAQIGRVWNREHIIDIIEYGVFDQLHAPS